ncbi:MULTISPECIES: hypothetical protein [unclassified Microcoleus]|uniref:hypothetical protein n=1 Tax=unclassified Microcoleus TaxID=2642155 RepID=UPI002FD2387D
MEGSCDRAIGYKRAIAKKIQHQAPSFPQTAQLLKAVKPASVTAFKLYILISYSLLVQSSPPLPESP